MYIYHKNSWCQAVWSISQLFTLLYQSFGFCSSFPYFKFHTSSSLVLGSAPANTLINITGPKMMQREYCREKFLGFWVLIGPAMLGLGGSKTKMSLWNNVVQYDSCDRAGDRRMSASYMGNFYLPLTVDIVVLLHVLGWSTIHCSVVQLSVM